MRATFPIVLLAGMMSHMSPAAADPVVQRARAALSATRARDIGGFALGMHIRDAAKIAPIEALGNDNFQTVRDGVTYDFEVTPNGRIYRIISTQPLGRFIVDESFRHALAEKLASKYGPPNDASGGTFGWSLVEPVARIDGPTLPFTTMWASAYVQDDPTGVSIEMKMIDFRILWHDQNELNRAPRQQAAAAIGF